MHIFHKWGKWEQYVDQYITIDKASKREYKAIEKRQKRKCLICNKEEDREV